MSTANIIKQLLNIQDKNISFEDNCVREKIYKGNKCNFIEGKLSYHPTHCKMCGTVNENYMIYKNRIMIHFKFKAKETNSEQKKTHVKAS